jgi:hypothetical protein
MLLGGSRRVAVADEGQSWSSQGVGGGRRISHLPMTTFPQRHTINQQHVGFCAHLRSIGPILTVKSSPATLIHWYTADAVAFSRNCLSSLRPKAQRAAVIVRQPCVAQSTFCARRIEESYPPLVQPRLVIQVVQCVRLRFHVLGAELE